MSYLFNLLILTAVALSTLVIPASASAEVRGGRTAAGLISALKEVEVSVDQLIDARVTGANAEGARKETFANILDLFLLEIKDASAKLRSLPKKHRLAKDEENERQQFLKQLEANADYFRELQERLERPLHPETVKNLAKNLKEWHKDSYQPLRKRVAGYLLFFQNRELLTMAQNRLRLITADLKKIHDFKPIKDSPLPIVLERAADLIDEAEKLHSAAQLLLVKDEESSIYSIVEESLQKIRKAYDLFLEMSDLFHRLFQ